MWFAKSSVRALVQASLAPPRSEGRATQKYVEVDMKDDDATHFVCFTLASVTIWSRADRTIGMLTANEFHLLTHRII